MRRVVTSRTIRINPSRRDTTTTTLTTRRNNYVSMKQIQIDHMIVKIVPKRNERKTNLTTVSSLSYIPVPLISTDNNTPTHSSVPKTLTQEQVVEIKQLIGEELALRDLIYTYTNEALQSGALVLTSLTVGAFLLIIVNEVRYRNTQKKLHDILKDSNIMRIL